MSSKHQPASPPLQLPFKLADLVRYTGATGAQIQHWKRVGLLSAEIKQGRSPGDPDVFSMLNLVEVAQLVEQTRVHLIPAHMKLLMAVQRARLAKVPAQYRAQCAWANYVKQVMADAALLGETSDPRYVAWVRAVARTLPPLEKRAVVVPDTQLLELLAAEQASRSPARRARSFQTQADV